MRVRREADAQPALTKPGCEETFDLLAPSGLLDAAAFVPVGDDEERRRRRDPEALGEVGPLRRVDHVDAERVVIPAALKDLGEIPLHLPAVAGDGRGEEEEARLLRRGGPGDRMNGRHALRVPAERGSLTTIAR